MAETMTKDEGDYYRSQTELAKNQIKFLENQDRISEEQLEILKNQNKSIENQTRISKTLMMATIILALAGFSQTLYYFEIFSQSMVKDFYDVLALTLLGLIIFAITILLTRLINFLRNNLKHPY